MKYYIGIDLGGTNIVAGVVDEQFQLLAKASDKTRVGRPAQEIAQTMAQTAQDAAKAAGIGMDQVESVGILIIQTAPFGVGGERLPRHCGQREKGSAVCQQPLF